MQFVVIVPETNVLDGSQKLLPVYTVVAKEFTYDQMTTRGYLTAVRRNVCLWPALTASYACIKTPSRQLAIAMGGKNRPFSRKFVGPGFSWKFVGPGFLFTPWFTPCTGTNSPTLFDVTIILSGF